MVSGGGSGGGRSVLDRKETHMLGFPLTLLQQIWLLYLLPTLALNLVYILDLATDLAIGVELVREGRLVAGLATLAITYAPPLCLLLMRLAKPQPQRQQAAGPAAFITWLLVEMTAFIVYPLRPLFCFGERLFWCVEALRSEEEAGREEALQEFEETESRMMESYLFLQAFLQAGPQAVLQLALLILTHSANEHTEEMQAVCLVSSLVSVSLVTANYHRYESQAKGGRKRVLGNAPPSDSDSADLLDSTGRSSLRLPVRTRWIKAMAEDVPLGKVVLFVFWFNFLLGRILCLGLAAKFFPVVVLGVCVAHYILFFVYILPSPKFTASLPTKVFLPFIFVFCLIEVGIQFAKPGILYTLFYLVTVGENIGLTVVWIVWGDWSTHYWYHYSLYVVSLTHLVAFIFLVVYIKYYRPKVKRLRPRSQEIRHDEAAPLTQAPPPPPPHETYID